MFHSLEYVYDSNGIRLTYKYKLTDSDFETEIKCSTGIISFETISKIASEYKKRKLNIAANLALYFKSMKDQDDYWNLDYIVSINNRYEKKSSERFYKKYLVDIKKYMTLV